jgi:hypothetical protein
MEDASGFQDPGLLPVLHSSENPEEEGTFLVFKGVYPSLSENLQLVLDLPLEGRLQVFRQITEVILERAACESLRSPVGLAHVSLQVKTGGTPSVYLPPLDLAAWVSEYTGQSAHLKDYVPYLPPEHPEGDRTRPSSLSSAMYNLGAMGYHILTKQKPCGDGDIKSCLENHKRLQPAPASILDPAIPSAVSALVDRMLQKDPARRPGDRQEVLDVICRAGGNLAGGNLAGGNLAGGAPAGGPTTAAPPPPARPKISKPARAPAIPVASGGRAALDGRKATKPEDGKWRLESLKYLPLWTIVWVGLFLLARFLSKAVFRAMDG